MKTRRKSKAAVASSASQEQDSSQTTDDVTSNLSFSLAIPADIDLETLSGLLGTASLTSVSAESVIKLYRTLLAQDSRVDAVQRDLDEARAEAERKDIELDQALQDRETTSKDLEAALEAAHNEATRAKQERDEIGPYTQIRFSVFLNETHQLPPERNWRLIYRH
jgi:nucleoprotein TPR